jgi:hypothetical protein
MSIPNKTATQTADSDLVPNRKRPRWDWHGPFSGQHVKPTAAMHMADGHRLIVSSTWSSVLVFGFISVMSFIILAMLCLTIAVGFWHGEKISDISNEFLIPIPILLFTGIFFGILMFKVGKERFFIFDRDHQTVLFPKGIFKRGFVVPFDQVECYGGRYVTIYGGYHYVPILFPKVVPKGHGRVWRRFIIGNTKEETQQQWRLICDFMNKNRPLPNIGATGMFIDFFTRNNITLDDYYNGIMPESIMPEVDYLVDQFDKHPDGPITPYPLSAEYQQRQQTADVN